jgi:hypothetical protein
LIAQMAKSQTDALFERLHANGLRKRVARDLSSALSKGNGTRAGKAANGTIAELRKLVADLEDRAKGGPERRKAAAQKAAATRKREAAKRSTAAKKAAQTRAKRSSGSSTRTRSSSSRAKTRA